MTLINISVDVERDLHNNTYLGITEGLKIFERLVSKHKFKPTLFVTGDVIEKYGNIFKILQDKGWEIGYHGYNHERYDEMSYSEKERDIRRGIEIFKRYGLNVKGFRAPQHSIDNGTFELLKENGFKYDSSKAARDAYQVVHVVRGINKLRNWLKQFFSKTEPYKINGLYEIPTSALFFSFVGYSLRILPLFLVKFLFLLLSRRKVVVFYCHSWDFIKIKKSLTYKICDLDKFLKRFDGLLKFMSKGNKFMKLDEIG